MLTCPCGRSSRLSLCRACGGDLDRLLAAVPGLLADLDVTLARQDRVSASGGGGRTGRTEQPLPYNLAAAEALDVLTSTLAGWAEAIEAPPALRVPQLAARHLRRHLDAVRSLPEAEACLDEVTFAVAFARRAIDTRLDAVWIGTCGTPWPVGPDEVEECPTALFATVDDEAVECPRCRTVVDPKRRRGTILDLARSQDLPAADLVRIVAAYGYRTSAVAVSRLVKREALVSVGTHADGRPTYRVGDLLSLLAERSAP